MDAFENGWVHKDTRGHHATQGFAAQVHEAVRRGLLQPLACAVEDDLRLQALEDSGDDGAVAAAALARATVNGTCQPLDKGTVRALLHLPPLHVAGSLLHVCDWVAVALQRVLTSGVVNAPQDVHTYTTMRSLALACYGLQLSPLPPPPNDHGTSLLSIAHVDASRVVAPLLMMYCV